MMVRKSNAGFTLIELLVVVAIIAILAAIAIPQFGKYRKDAAIKACMSDVRNALISCQGVLTADPTKSSCAQGDYPSSTTHASGISVTVDSTGNLTATGNCKGAASDTTVTCNNNGCSASTTQQ